MASSLKKEENSDWERLQRKIFTRWANQKLRGTTVQPVSDVVAAMADGLLLISLMEVLSEKKYAGKIEKNPKMRPHKIDNASNALKFTWECGVEMKMKPSAENLVDENVKEILGLMWAIMLKYMKLVDDDDASQSQSIKDALLMWAQNKTHGYNGVKVDNFGSSWHDGLAFCAILHKHKPQLLNFDALSKDNKKENLELAMSCAEKYFGLEKYLTTDEITKLDEKSMVVYVSEYYYGIYEQRKLDLAAKRIGKVIKLTKENDAMKKKYGEDAAQITGLIERSAKLLEDRTIDNTMAGARKRIEDFYAYKVNDKNVILGLQLDLEALFNNLAMRLSYNERPEFKPQLTLKDVDGHVKHLEECERERKVALHAELNRQIKLLALDGQHRSRSDKLTNWTATKKAYLEKKETIDSVSGAQLHLRLLDAYDLESKSVYQDSVTKHLKVIGAELVKEKYERSTEVEAREAEIESGFTKLNQLSADKRPVLEDDLAREQFKAKVRLMVQAHVDSYSKLHAWTVEKENYLKVKESVNSISDAQLHLSILDNYDKEAGRQRPSADHIKSFGEEILGMKYTGKYSSWSYEHPQEITDRNNTIESQWGVLTTLSAQKREILDDDLARENYKSKVRLMVQAHVDAFTKLNAWTVEKENYLKTKETINSISDAQVQLSILDNYDQEYARQKPSADHIKSFGNEILGMKYTGKHSTWSYEHPEEITERMNTTESRWALLATLAAEKREVLDDDLAREQFKAKVRLMVQAHVDAFTKFNAWSVEKENYLKTKESVNSIADAQTHLSILDNYDKEYARQKPSADHIKEAGNEILGMKYTGKHSTWSYEHPQEITDRMNTTESRWALLASLAAEKRKTLDADLAREQEKERLRLEFAHLASEYLRWAKETSEDVAGSHFGYTLEEVEAFQATLDKSNSEIDGAAGSKQSECQNVKSQMDALNVTENIYSSITLNDIAKAKTELASAQTNRNTHFAAELKRQRDNDALCREFAGVADPFSKWIGDEKDKVTNAKSSLEEQLKYVDERIAQIAADGARVNQVHDLNSKMEAAGIVNNRHTTLTAKDVDVQWEQYQAFMQKKKKMLEDTIETEKLKGVTPDQLKEIEDNFKSFDSDKSGNIDKKELKACLYSLGEEKKPSEVEAILKSYGNGTQIPFEGFKNFMVSVLAVTDKKDDVLAAFKLINKGEDTANKERLDFVMTPADVDYFVENASKSGNGYDYATWTESVFAR